MSKYKVKGGRKGFLRFGKFCNTCDKYFRAYTKKRKDCVCCLDKRPQIRYFQSFPKWLPFEEIEKKVYLRLIKERVIEEMEHIKLENKIVKNSNGNLTIITNN